MRPLPSSTPKDILRAARLPLLHAADPEVAKDLRRVAKGTALSPILLVRGDLAAGLPLQIADGYHGVCQVRPERGHRDSLPDRRLLGQPRLTRPGVKEPVMAGESQAAAASAPASNADHNRIEAIVHARHGARIAGLLEREPAWGRDFTDLSYEWRRLFSEVFGTSFLVPVRARR
jgi:hypothetical protein